MPQCPVAEAINNIRGGADFTEEDDFTRGDNIIKGGENSPDIVCEDMTFYITGLRIEVARAKMQKVSGAAAVALYKKLFGAAKTTGERYIEIIDQVKTRHHIYNKFVGLVDMIGDIENVILEKIDKLAENNSQINISLPSLDPSPTADIDIIFSPAALCSVVNQITEYINKLDVAAISTNQISCSRLEKLKPLDLKFDFDKELPELDEKKEIMPQCEQMLKIQISIAEYIREIELYQCKAINHMGKIYNRCGEIISALTS